MSQKGYAVWTNPDGSVKERDTFTCIHCNSLVFIEPKTNPSDLGGFCRMCMKNICGPCADAGMCVPFEKKLKEIEARDRLMRRVHLG